MMIYRLLALLAWLFMLALGTHYDYECEQLDQCKSIISEISFNGVFIPTNISNMTIFCREKYPAYTNCKWEHFVECFPYEYEYNIKSVDHGSMLDHLCQEKVITDLENSVCHNNWTKSNLVFDKVFEPPYDSALEENDPELCNKLKGFRAHTREVVEEFCGWRLALHVYQNLFIRDAFQCGYSFYQYSDSADLRYCFSNFWQDFECDNGACIAGDLSCDGQEDCKDSSDEKYCGTCTNLLECDTAALGFNLDRLMPLEYNNEYINPCRMTELIKTCGEIHYDESEHCRAQTVHKRLHWTVADWCNAGVSNIEDSPCFQSHSQYQLLGSKLEICRPETIMNTRSGETCSGRAEFGKCVRDVLQEECGWEVAYDLVKYLHVRLGLYKCGGECTRLIECGRLLSGLSNFTVLPVDHDLQRSCSKLEEFKNCQEQHYEACNIQAIKEQSDTDNEVLSYICKEHVIEDITMSPCFLNRAKYEEVESEVYNCDRNVLETYIPKRCRKLKVRRNCIRAAVEEKCGWKVGFHVYYMTVIRHEFKYFDFNCYNEAICTLDQFQCGTGSCIEGELACDGNNDCQDLSDELLCSLTIRKPEVQVGRRIECFAQGGLRFSDHIHWFKVKAPAAGLAGEEANVTEVFANQSDTLYGQYNIAEERRPWEYVSSLKIRSFDVADEETYTCRLSRNWSASYHIISPLQVEKSCTYNEFQCDDGACISAYLECDGRKNCTDNSDETRCDLTIKGPLLQATVGQEGKLECRSLGEKTQSKHIDWYRQISRGDNQQEGDVEFMPEINALDNQTYYHVKEETELYDQNSYFVSVLTIRELEVKDAGIYTCRLSNKLSASYKLEVDPLNTDQCPDTLQCDEFASCIRNQTGFACECNDGFQGNGQTCEDINECQNEDGAQLDTCSEEANTNCVNELGTYSCSCHSGYARYDSYDCEDINECEEFEDPCGRDRDNLCDNLQGTYTCPCRYGYYWNFIIMECTASP